MTFIKFACVGGIGFVVDALAMLVLSFYLPVIPARGIAFWIAASSNWWLNRCFTFKAVRRTNKLQQWLAFLAISCIGFIPNWGCYWLLIHHVDVAAWSLSFDQSAQSLILALWPFVAMLPGILLGMLSNYLFARGWVFKPALA